MPTTSLPSTENSDLQSEVDFFFYFLFFSPFAFLSMLTPPASAGGGKEVIEFGVDKPSSTTTTIYERMLFPPFPLYLSSHFTSLCHRSQW